MDNPKAMEDAQNALGMMIYQILNNQVKKTCFEKCFGQKFSEEMGKNEQICLAKCMDRMLVKIGTLCVLKYETHTIVTKASNEISKNLNVDSGY